MFVSKVGSNLCLMNCINLCLQIFSLRKQELLKYFSIFRLLSPFHFSHVTSSNFHQILAIYHIYTNTITIDYFLIIFPDFFFFDFFWFFPFFSDFFNIFLIFLHSCKFLNNFYFPIFFTTIFTQTLSCHFFLLNFHFVSPFPRLTLFFKFFKFLTYFFFWKLFLLFNHFSILFLREHWTYI